MVKNLPANAGDADLIPGLGRSPEEGMATHSSILAWRIPWTEEPGGLVLGAEKSRTRLNDQYTAQLPYYTAGETEAQRGQALCSKSH